MYALVLWLNIIIVLLYCSTNLVTLTFAVRPKNPCICNFRVHALSFYISLNGFFQKPNTTNVRGWSFDIQKLNEAVPFFLVYLIDLSQFSG